MSQASKLRELFEFETCSTEPTSHGKLRDWDNNVLGLDGQKPAVLSGRSRENTSEFVRKRFGVINSASSTQETEIVSEDELKSVSDMIRARKRTLTKIMNLFGFGQPT